MRKAKGLDHQSGWRIRAAAQAVRLGRTLLGWAMGFEPTTLGSTARCSTSKLRPPPSPKYSTTATGCQRSLGCCGSPRVGHTSIHHDGDLWLAKRLCEPGASRTSRFGGYMRPPACLSGSSRRGKGLLFKASQELPRRGILEGFSQLKVGDNGTWPSLQSFAFSVRHVMTRLQSWLPA